MRRVVTQPIATPQKPHRDRVNADITSPSCPAPLTSENLRPAPPERCARAAPSTPVKHSTALYTALLSCVRCHTTVSPRLARRNGAGDFETADGECFHAGSEGRPTLRDKPGREKYGRTSWSVSATVENLAKKTPITVSPSASICIRSLKVPAPTVTAARRPRTRAMFANSSSSRRLATLNKLLFSLRKFACPSAAIVRKKTPLVRWRSKLRTAVLSQTVFFFPMFSPSDRWSGALPQKRGVEIRHINFHNLIIKNSRPA